MALQKGKTNMIGPPARKKRAKRPKGKYGKTKIGTIGSPDFMGNKAGSAFKKPKGWKPKEGLTAAQRQARRKQWAKGKKLRKRGLGSIKSRWN